MKNFKEKKSYGIEVLFEQVPVGKEELNSKVDSIFDILFEETLKSLPKQEVIVAKPKQEGRQTLCLN